MRLICLALFCLAAAGTLCAQKNFEGTILYTVKENNKPVGGMTVHFGESAMRASIEEENGMEKMEVMLFFDSLMVAEIDHNSKEYRVTYYEDVASYSSGIAEIGGYKTKRVAMGRKPSMLGYFPGATFFVADDLVYQIPAAMTGINELLMVNGGKIVLGFILPDKKSGVITSFDSSFADPEFHGVIAKATSIIAKKEDPLLFRIPLDYTRKNMSDQDAYGDAGAYGADDSTAMYTDSIVAMIDTTASMAMDTAAVSYDEPTVKEPSRPAAPKKPAAKKLPVKKTKTPAAARKPE